MSALSPWNGPRRAAAPRAGALAGALAMLLATCTPRPAEVSPAPPAASLAAPASGPAGEAPRPADAPVRTRAAFTSFSASAAPWWMALEGGYFRQQGLEVELVQIAAGSPLLAAMHNGDVELVFSGGPALVLGNLEGLETMVLGSTSRGLDLIIFVRPELQTVDDVRGKTIGAGRPKSVTDTVIRLALPRVGLRPDVDVFVGVTGGLPESLAGLQAGTLDGAILNVPMIFDARKQGFRELMSLAEQPIPFLSSAVGATKKTLAQRPELPERFLRALAQAVSRLKTDRDAAIDVIGKYTQNDDRDLLGATVDYNRSLWVTDPYPDMAGVQQILDIEEHPGARTARAEDFVDLRYAERMRESGFLEGLAK